MSDAAHRAVRPAVGGAPNVAPGVLIADRFRLETMLGAGGMAEVWRAHDLAAQRPVAVKLLRPQVAASAEAVQRLAREGALLSALRHPSIVRVETHGRLEGGGVFVAMELLDGETLGARMRRGRMEPTELAPIVAGTCAGLAAAHAHGIIHRDLKPDNVFLVRSASGEPQVKLLDFGISKVYGGDRITQTGEVLGTPRYMSPEQLGAERDVDARIDVYALGVILYEALGGRPPFLAATPTDLIVAIVHGKVAPLRSLRPDLSPALEAVVMRAMARAREARFQSATALADAFLEAAGATARARMQPKANVLRTQALGGAGSEARSIAATDPPSADLGNAALGPRRASEPESFRPGTFSALDAVDPLGVRDSAHAPLALAQTLLAPSGLLPPAAGPAATQSLAASAAPRSAAFSSAAFSGPSGETQGASPSAGQPAAVATRHAPSRSPVPGRLLLGTAALLAGALSAAVVLAALHSLRGTGARVPAPRPAPHPAPAAPVAPPAPDSADSQPEGIHAPATPAPAGPAPAAAAAGVEAPGAASANAPSASPSAPPAVAAPRPTTAAAPRIPGRGHRADPSRDATGGSPRADDARAEVGAGAGAGAPSAQWPGTSDPLELARRALADGQPEECIAILDEVIRRGGTPIALRRRADCLLRAGRREEAIRDYQRFCRIAPDHPTVAEVRERMAGMGLTCP